MAKVQLDLYPEGVSMSDLQQLLKQQEELAAKIAKAREQSREEAIEKIKKIVQEADLKITDIYNAFPKKTVAKTGTRLPPKPKYTDGTNFWTGRGALPRWIVTSGKPKEAFLIK